MVFTAAVVRVAAAVRGARTPGRVRFLGRLLGRFRFRALTRAPVGVRLRAAVRAGMRAALGRVLRVAAVAVVLATVAAGAAAGTPVDGTGFGARAPAGPGPGRITEAGAGAPEGAEGAEGAERAERAERAEALGEAMAAGCSGGTGAAARCWPVTGPGVRGRPEVLRLFDPPPAPWAAGHRGVDLRAAPGAPVRAAAPGVVVFAGPVGGTPVLVLRLAGGLRATYEPVRASVPVGARVAAGQPVGTLNGSVAHCPGPCLHWGLLAGTVYLDPLSLLPAALRRCGPSRLLPLAGG